MFALDCERPLRPPSRHVLSGVDVVRVGRGERDARRKGSELRVSIPDRSVSGEHLELQFVRGRWILEDAGSKNGTRVNGSAVRRAVLLDGDLVEVGHTLFLFRDRVPAAPGAPDLMADELTADLPGLATFSSPLAEARDELVQVAPTDVSIVVLGETGTGKEVVARAVHALSRRAGAFVPVNCGAVPPSLIESILFGHRKGAFSGASEDRPGLVRSADGGTLFLDEIGDLPAASQVAFLRVLQEREVVPVGDARPVKVDVRLVTATHRPLGDLVKAGAFRADLYARTAGLTVKLPRLVERREDLGVLIGALLRRLAPEPDRLSFTVGAARALFRHDWPLNVRELEKCLGVAVALAGGAQIQLGHLPEPVRGTLPATAPGVDGDDRLRAELVALLTEHNGNISIVARAMGKGRMQIHRWLKRYGLEPATFRRP
jgi:DNA-binding NtrC family response regulator